MKNAHISGTKRAFKVALLVLGVLGAIGIGGSIAQLPLGHPDKDIENVLGEDPAASMGVTEWPEDEEIAVGYCFDKADYSVLDTYLITRDEVSMLGERGELLVDWDADANAYRGTVKRTIVLEHNDTWNLEITVYVAPDHRTAKQIMAGAVANQLSVPYLSSYLPVWGSNFGVSAGQLLILRDVVDKSGGWSAANSVSLSCIQNNVLIELDKDEACTLNLPALAHSMVEELLAQEAARVIASEPLKPVVSVISANSTIDFPSIDAVNGYMTASVSNGITVGISGWVGTVHKYAFFGARTHPVESISSSGIQYNIAEHVYRPFYNDGSFDSVGNPTSVAIIRSLEGQYHIVVAAWGDNLVAAFAHDSVEVVRGK